MYSVRISTTSDREYPPVDFGYGVTWDRLSELLRREVSADAGSILAEPVADARRGQTDWHVTANEDPRPLSALSPEERSKLLGILDEHRAAISALADRLSAQGGEANERLATALRAVVNVPDVEHHTWWVDGKPVLVAWGRRSAIAAPRDATIIARSKAPVVVGDPGATILGTGQAGQGRGPASVLVMRDIREASWLTALLWALLALLILMILYVLLAPCAVNLPILRWWFDRCELSQGDRELDLLRDRNRALAEAVRKAEVAAASRETECRAGKRSEAPIDTNPRQRLGQADTKDSGPPPDAKELERRREEAGGSHGALDITLAWNGREDLDLTIDCPGGRLYHGSRQGCGGKFEVDRNANVLKMEDGPVEHASWPNAPPAGQYQVNVMYYGTNNGPQRAVPFRVEVRDGAKAEEFTGTAEKTGVKISVTQFER